MTVEVVAACKVRKYQTDMGDLPEYEPDPALMAEIVDYMNECLGCGGLGEAEGLFRLPLLRAALARDAKVREVAPDAVWLAKLARSGSWPGGMAQAVENATSRVIRTLGTDDDRAVQEAVNAALYPWPGK